MATGKARLQLPPLLVVGQRISAYALSNDDSADLPGCSPATGSPAFYNSEQGKYVLSSQEETSEANSECFPSATDVHALRETVSPFWATTTPPMSERATTVYRTIL